MERITYRDRFNILILTHEDLYFCYDGGCGPDMAVSFDQALMSHFDLKNKRKALKKIDMVVYANLSLNRVKLMKEKDLCGDYSFPLLVTSILNYLNYLKEPNETEKTEKPGKEIIAPMRNRFDMLDIR
jgi:hypothetical protein